MQNKIVARESRTQSSIIYRAKIMINPQPLLFERVRTGFTIKVRTFNERYELSREEKTAGSRTVHNL